MVIYVKIYFIHGVVQYDHRKFRFNIKCYCEKLNSSVDWSQLYDANYYKQQEETYRNIRPTLLSNSLTVPGEQIRDHVEILTNKHYFGIKQQIEGFYRTNKTNSSKTICFY